MRAVVQRVERASVSWPGGGPEAIGPGLLLLLALEVGDDEGGLARLFGRLSRTAVFEDGGGIRAVPPAGTPLLLVPNFTIAARHGSGAVPDFGRAMPPASARALFAAAPAAAEEAGFSPACGEFGARMEIDALLEGPVTYHLTA